jgi:5-methylcytosine-specific restriction enzyme A
MRTEFTKSIKRLALLRCNGRCEECTRPLHHAGDYHYDHIIADAAGGDASVDNCAVLCKSCHLVKTTSQDMPRIAKLKRIRDRHHGIHRNRVRIAYRKFDGTPVRPRD